jgi:hypothetical protein
VRDRGISKHLGLGDEHASTLAATVFEIQRHEGEQPRRGCRVRYAPASGTMASAADPNTRLCDTPASVRDSTAVVPYLGGSGHARSETGLAGSCTSPAGAPPRQPMRFCSKLTGY